MPPFASLGGAYEAVDRSEDTRGREIIWVVAPQAEPGATGVHNRGSLWYMVLVEERQRDLRLLNPFIPQRTKNYALAWLSDLTLPESAESDPGYVLKQESPNAAAFWQVGFGIVPVEEGFLCRLVRSGECSG